MKLPTLYTVPATYLHEYISNASNEQSGAPTSGISLENYYNVRIGGTDMGNNACNYVFSRLPGYGGLLVRRCNDVYGCYRRINYLGAGGINGLRNNLATIIGGSGYDVEAEVNTRNSCA
jgi:hypothetical protein